MHNFRPLSSIYKDIGLLGGHTHKFKKRGGHLILCPPPFKTREGGTCPPVSPQMTPMRVTRLKAAPNMADPISLNENRP